MKMRALMVSVGLLVVTAVSASAQSTTLLPAPPTAVEVQVIAPGADPAGAAVANLVTPISLASAACGQVAPPNPVTTSPTNPTFAQFDDPFTANRVCFAPIPVGLATGTGYRLRLLFDAPTCKDPNTLADITPCNSTPTVVTLPFAIAPTQILVRHAAPTGGAFKP